MNNNKQPSVAVLMSTYNGQRFLKEQIDSVLSQNNVCITLFIRDDGSKDNTLKIIELYKKQVIFLQGINIGVGNSFMKVLSFSGQNFDYYAFCDQDDIWLPQKIYKAICMIHRYNEPVCYCSNQTLVDSHGNIIKERYTDEIDTGYMRILCNNQVTGCTMVWNKKLQTILISAERFPSYEILRKRIHDVWVAMVASVTGILVYDKNSYILYRQHENNVVGVKKTSLFYEWAKKINNPSLRNGRSSLAKEIIDKYDDLIIDRYKSKKLKLYAYYQDGWKNKIRLLLDNELQKYSEESLLQLKGKVFLNLF